MIAAVALLLAAANPEPGEVLAAAPDSDWRPIPAGELIGFQTPRGTMVMQLAPAFSPAHVAALKALIFEKSFDNGAITRVQDNYVVQWRVRKGTKTAPIGPETAYERPETGLKFTPLGHSDAFGEAGFIDGWPVARASGRVWPVHCYATVGVGRDMPPDVGDATELYAVIGHAPRHLDRNLSIVGRIIDGFAEHASLPRGTGPLGTYESEAENIPIIKAFPMPADTRYEYLDTASASFQAYKHARANRGSFFVRPAGTIDLCNVPVPIRKAEK
ncbi:peptidylprolyl isomerase [Polymorphobacter sp.]|uniref:peptidylprolyl isomerase n=1 Tax=Polymorphobacter sp. TaxID=1909290 RepID=UPI003F70DFF0